MWPYLYPHVQWPAGVTYPYVASLSNSNLSTPIRFLGDREGQVGQEAGRRLCEVQAAFPGQVFGNLDE